MHHVSYHHYIVIIIGVVFVCIFGLFVKKERKKQTSFAEIFTVNGVSNILKNII